MRISKAPTNPHPTAARRSFDIADLYRGPVELQPQGAAESEIGLDEKLRQAYFWIVNTAIISPHYDIEYNEEPPQEFVIGLAPFAYATLGAQWTFSRSVRRS